MQLSRYWLRAPWRWRNSVETCSGSVIKSSIINCWSVVHLLVHYTDIINLIQWQFLGQTAASGCESIRTFRKITPSPFLGCAGGLVAPKLNSQFWCYKTSVTSWLGCMPEKMTLNSLAANDSRLNNSNNCFIYLSFS